MIEIKKIKWKQIAEHAPFLRNREDLERKAKTGIDTWDVVERSGAGLFPILRKNGGLAAIWLPRLDQRMRRSSALSTSSRRGEGDYYQIDKGAVDAWEWHHAIAVPLPTAQLFTQYVQETPLLRAIVAETPNLWLFSERYHLDPLSNNNLLQALNPRWMEVMLSDKAIMPLLSRFSEPWDNASWKMHLDPQTLVAWFISLPCMVLTVEELDLMPETTDGEIALIEDTGSYNAFTRWNFGHWASNSLGKQWLVGRRRYGMTQHGASYRLDTQRTEWFRFIPSGLVHSVEAPNGDRAYSIPQERLYFDQGRYDEEGRQRPLEQRFIARDIPKNKATEAMRSRELLLESEIQDDLIVGEYEEN